MKRKVSYRVVFGNNKSSDGITKFEEKVERLLNDGYELNGQVGYSVVEHRSESRYDTRQTCYSNLYLLQSLVKYEVEEDETKHTEQPEKTESSTVAIPVESFNSNKIEKMNNSIDKNLLLALERRGITRVNYVENKWWLFKDSYSGDTIGALVNPIHWKEFLNEVRKMARCRGHHGGKDYCSECWSYTSMSKNEKVEKIDDPDLTVLGVFRGFAGLPLIIRGLKFDYLHSIPTEKIDEIVGFLLTAMDSFGDSTLAGYK